MELWNIWFILVNSFKPACSRQQTFFWFIVILIGFSLQSDFLGVTSLARGAGLLPNYYTCLLHFFDSDAVDLSHLRRAWITIIFSRFTSLVKINGRYVIVGDGIKIGKEGKKMPGVKWLHQESDSNSKAEYIMGHSIQVLAILAQGLASCFAIPLTGEIHEGIRYHYKDNRTLLDKIFSLLISLDLPEKFYFMGDKYYCSGPLMKKLVASGSHMMTMMKKNAVAYYPCAPVKRKGRGRPPKYGHRVKLFDLFQSDLIFTKAPLPNHPKLMMEYCVLKLFWKPTGELAQFVLVKHPTRGNNIAMSTDLTLPSLDLISAYSLRFKIEVAFKQAVHQIGTFMYRFWLKVMRPKPRKSGDQQLQFAPAYFKEKVIRKLNAYQLFIQLGLIAQGLMQYLSIYHSTLVWGNFRSWLRTRRENKLPSEKVVSSSLSSTYSEFLADSTNQSIFKKFLTRRIGFIQNKSYFLGEVPTD
jgi:hypothetical protein